MPRALPPIVLLAALALVAGCAPAPKGVRPEPTAVGAPFASEEEALAAAVEVYDRLTVLSDEIARAGGAGAEQLEQVATGEFLRASMDGFEGWVEKGWIQRGGSGFRNVELQQYSVGPKEAVVVYLCHDISAVDVVDAMGVSVVSLDRPDTNYMQVVFDLGGDHELRVSERLLWDEREC